MTPNQSMGFTPFFLTYGSEAVLPSDLDYGAPRVKAFDLDRTAEAQQDVVDLLEEARETTLLRSAHETIHNSGGGSPWHLPTEDGDDNILVNTWNIE